jgi:hypothetical protein
MLFWRDGRQLFVRRTWTYMNLVQFWVQLLPLKVRQWVHFPHPFLEYVFYYYAVAISRAKICSTYLFLGALFAPTFYYWKSTCVKVIKSKLNTALWVICLLYSIYLLFCYILKCCYLVRWTLLRFYSFARSGDFTWVRFFLVVGALCAPKLHPRAHSSKY